MIDYDSIWRTQDEIRTVVNAVLGECIWNLSYEHRRTSLVEVAAVGVVAVDVEHPAAALPVQRAIEVAKGSILVVLPGGEHVAEVSVTAAPPSTEHVTSPIDAHQIVEVNLIDGIVLCVCQVQLVGHLI